MKFAGIAFHVDSLNEAYDFPPDYEDPTFTSIADRFLGLADEFNFKATCFVIGRDLEKQAHRQAVSNWSNKGHEIASHSYTHLYNFGALSEEVIRKEIAKTHEAIINTVGIAPLGFVAPNWSSSRRHLEIVQDFGYSYDASLFPSWLRFPATLKMYANCLAAGNGRSFTIINQRDMGYALAGTRKPQILKEKDKELVLLPLPSNRFRVGCWHTLAFMFGQKTHEKILKSCLEDCEYFYYVLHPGDLIDPKEVDTSRPSNLARLDVSLEKKMSLIRSSLEIIAKSGRKIFTMAELAKAAAGSHTLRKAS